MGRTQAALASMAAAAALCAVPSVQAQTASRPDAMAKAYLFGAAFKQSDLSRSKPGGMMFLPGRGLVRWETRGKTLAEQEELKTEAIGLADARAVQAEIDAQRIAPDRAGGPSAERLAAHGDLGLMAIGSAATPLNLAPVTGDRSQAGGVIPLNRAGRAVALNNLPVQDGSSFRGRSRVYLFGAVSGTAVGLNLMHDGGAGWRNGGLTTDRGGFIGQRQAGVAIRRGMAQAALSLVQEKTQVHILGMSSIKDRRAMLSLSLTPGAPR